MKVVAVSEFNTEPALHDVATPEARDGEVVVDVEFASINGMDLMTWTGVVEQMMPYELPITLGRDFAGTVATLGPGVTDLAVGDPVFGILLSMPLHDGTLAEQARVLATGIAKRPGKLDPKAAGALGLAGGAAKAAIDAIAPAPGETVLICGATGGVGAVALQMAKQRGASVIATASPGKAAFVEELGADEVVDYTGDLAAAVRERRPNGVDAVVHLAGDGVALADLLVPGGRLASTLGVGPDQVAGRDVQATPVMTIPRRDMLSELATAVVDGELRVPITKTYSLDQAGQAIKDFGSGSLGKLAVAVP